MWKNTRQDKWVSFLYGQVDSAYEQMCQTKVQFGKTDQRQGYHMIISFGEGEVDAAYKDVCNPITGEFRKELYDDILSLYAEMEQFSKNGGEKGPRIHRSRSSV